jgi:hypothetical protein
LKRCLNDYEVSQIPASKKDAFERALPEECSRLKAMLGESTE